MSGLVKHGFGIIIEPAIAILHNYEMCLIQHGLKENVLTGGELKGDFSMLINVETTKVQITNYRVNFDKFKKEHAQALKKCVDVAQTTTNQDFLLTQEEMAFIESNQLFKPRTYLVEGVFAPNIKIKMYNQTQDNKDVKININMNINRQHIK
ncbi:MAG: hypothetical protein ISR65_13965 [Bacteriovoracaceae bacterium]|nr:hypothetical protein [Bacteriovoracaceae bacterium]